MIDFGTVLYLILLVLVLMFWRQRRGRSLSELIDGNGTSHHHVHRVIGAHPRGGTWRQHQQWMRQAEE